MRRLDIGVVAYGNPEGLERAVASMHRTMKTDYRILVVVNPHPEPPKHAATLAALTRIGNPRVHARLMPENVGYAGGVNEILKWAETDYIAYSDHDATFNIEGWDERMCALLDSKHEIGMLFPNGGAAMIPCGEYCEILWGVGCAWVLTRLCYADVGGFDTEIGHHEEVDYGTRVRLAGYLVAAIPEISVSHEAVATSNPASLERINRGVRAWVDKWCGYFAGKDVNYHSKNVLRHTDWNVHALHMEKYFLMKLGPINANPEVISIDGADYDLIKVPRPKGYYRDRIV
jgi:GT2 family glycosyltransferase